jgi:uncharacterized protein (TIGR00252 family)
MSTTQRGREAEEKVAGFLKDKGHKIVELNWRTRWCEIDVVSTYKKCVYFTEVKFRGSSDWGSGLDHITEKKLNQMQYAADFWIATNNWKKEAQLQAAEVDSEGTINLIEITA